MLKKYGLLAASLVILIVMAGCIDLFAVPGIALSPDGSSMVFLSGGSGLSGDDADAASDSEDDALNLMRLDLASGETSTLVEGDDTASAFDINPANGDVAYIFTHKDTGSSIMVVGADGSSSELVAPAQFAGISIGTMMAFSPDGSKLAYTVIQLPPDVTLDSLEGDESEMTPEQLQAIKFAAYVYDMASGQVTAISDLETERANTVAWSPDGSKLAYNAWIDSNDDGTIATGPSLDFSGQGSAPSDVSRISVYDFGSGSTTPVDDPGLNFAPEFLSNRSLAFLSTDAGDMSAPPAVKVVDLGSGAVTTAYTPTGGSVLGIAPSPDGSQVAWVESPTPTGDSEAEPQPSSLYVAGADFASPTKVADIPAEMQLTDVPVWTQDGGTIYVSATNLLAAIPAQMTASFSGEETETSSDEPPSGQVVSVDVASGEVTPVYSGTMINSSFFAGIFSLATSGGEDMFGTGSE